MAATPRITVSISALDKKRLNKVLRSLDLKSPGQLLQMLVSGDSKRIDWIADGLKKVNELF